MLASSLPAPCTSWCAAGPALPLLLTLLLLAPARPARACGTPARLDRVHPSSGSRNVPINAKVFVYYQQDGPLLPSPVVLDEDGGVVPSDAEAIIQARLDVHRDVGVILTPREFLRHRSLFRVALRTQDPDGGAQDVLSGAFETGATVYAQPAYYAGAESAVFQELPERDQGGSCGVAPARIRYEIRGAGHPDAVGYVLYQDGQKRDLRPEPYGAMEEAAQPRGVIRHCFLLRMVDQTGTEDSNATEVCTGDEEPPADAGPAPDALPDAGRAMLRPPGCSGSQLPSPATHGTALAWLMGVGVVAVVCGGRSKRRHRTAIITSR